MPNAMRPPSEYLVVNMTIDANIGSVTSDIQPDTVFNAIKAGTPAVATMVYIDSGSILTSMSGFTAITTTAGGHQTTYTRAAFTGNTGVSTVYHAVRGYDNKWSLIS